MNALQIIFLVLSPLMLLPVPICGFGFLASFEEKGVTGWKVGYATAGIVFLLLSIVFLILGLRGVLRRRSSNT